MAINFRSNTVIRNLSIGPAAGSGGGSGIPIATNGLFLFYDASNVASYSGTGNTLTNLANTDPGYDLTIDGGATYNSDGTATNLTFPTGGTLIANLGDLLAGITAETTISHWIKPINSSDYNVWLFSRYDGAAYTPPNGNIRIIAGNRIIAENWGREMSTNLYPSISSNLNSWINIVMTYGPSGIVVYLNGTSLGAGSGSSFNNSTTLDTQSDFKVFFDYGTATSNYSVANFAYYTSELSASEVSSNFEALRGRFGI